MDFKLLKTLFSYERIPVYLKAIAYAVRRNIFTFKLELRGMLSLPEGVLLYKLAQSLKQGSVILEVGCYGGLSTAYLLAGSKDNKAMVYSIDPFDKDLEKQKSYLKRSKDKGYCRGELPMLDNKPSKNDVEKRLKQKGFESFILIEGYSNEVFKNWNKKIDLLWIDGDHNYNQVKRDFMSWSKYLRKGGIIAIDDANKKDDSEYWNMGLIGPTKVVGEFIKEPNWISIGRVDAMVYATKNYT